MPAVRRLPPAPTTAIIAGGRDYVLGAAHFAWLDRIRLIHNITRVFVGKAPGADEGGELWAVSRGIAVDGFPADWNRHGRSAGPRRNRTMAVALIAIPTRRLCITFPGGRGTANMRTEAAAQGIPLLSYPD